VTVDLVIANLLQNAATARKAIAEAVSRIGGPRTCECASALASAIITQRDQIPEQTKRDLEVIVGKYLS
jgi:5'-methylthioadenosine phosphorylase